MNVLGRKQLLSVLILVVVILVLFSTPLEKARHTSESFVEVTRSVYNDLTKHAIYEKLYQEKNMTTSEEKVLQTIEPYQEKNKTSDETLQWSRVDELCKIYGNVNRAMPDDRQMLVHDEVKTAFCFVPKSGCTTLKVAFFISLHAIPLSVLDNKSKRPDNDMILQALRKHSFIGKSKKEKENVIKNYFKFVMYRNPVERLVSGYLSKIFDHPMIGLKSTEPERNWIRLETYKLVHPVKYKEWKERGANESIIISFPDFIQYWIKTGGIKNDEHFRTTFDLCAPCKIRYNYYGNFNTYAKGAGVLIDRIHGNMSYLLDPGKRNSSSFARNFYSEITDKQKKEIIDILAIDLQFYYTLFPVERDSHKTIMGVDFGIPSVL